MNAYQRKALFTVAGKSSQWFRVYLFCLAFQFSISLLGIFLNIFSLSQVPVSMDVFILAFLRNLIFFLLTFFTFIQLRKLTRVGVILNMVVLCVLGCNNLLSTFSMNIPYREFLAAATIVAVRLTLILFHALWLICNAIYFYKRRRVFRRYSAKEAETAMHFAANHNKADWIAPLPAMEEEATRKMAEKKDYEIGLPDGVKIK